MAEERKAKRARSSRADSLEALLRQSVESEQSAQKPPSARAPQVLGGARREEAPVVWLDESLLDDNPFQPRTRMNPQKMQQLVDSINENGQLQTARVRQHPQRSGRYQLVFGHRRREAIRQGANAGAREERPQEFIGQIRCEVALASNEEMLDAAFAENEDREDFSVFDRAAYYVTRRRILSRKLSLGTIAPDQEAEDNGEEGREGHLSPGTSEISWEQLARERKMPLTPRAIRRLVEVLALPKDTQDRLALVNLGGEDEFVGANEKHCRALLLLQSQPSAQRGLLKQIEDEKLSGNEALRRAEGIKPARAASKSKRVEQGASASTSTSKAPASELGAPSPDEPQSGQAQARAQVLEASALAPSESMTLEESLRLSLHFLAQAARLVEESPPQDERRREAGRSLRRIEVEAQSIRRKVK